jgi:hypothetical protein
MAETEVKRRIILKSYANWDPWIEVKKTASVKGDIWEYVNPEAIHPTDAATMSSEDLEGRTILKILTEPVRPTPAGITGKEDSKYSDLDKD